MTPKTNKLTKEQERRFDDKFGSREEISKGAMPKSFLVLYDKSVSHLASEIAKAEERVDKGWIDYFQHKDDMRKAGRKMAEEYLKNRAKPKFDPLTRRLAIETAISFSKKKGAKWHRSKPKQPK